MAQRGYPGIHAGMPTPQCLRSAIVVNGAPRSTSTARRPSSRPGSWWDRVFPVGAGLLAKRPEHSTSPTTAPSSSRASSLPHWLSDDLWICGHRKFLWERACSRWRWISLHQRWMCRRLHEQARSHIGSESRCQNQVGCKAAFASKLLLPQV
ncbi:nucleoid-structuring protein H-NS [Pseudomonas brassicacearum]|nr:nucleoid-structuring protein H-NS [Pseudomonas brassicacearum]